MMVAVSASAAATDLRARSPLAGVEILVVDDHDDARELLAPALELAGAKVTQADSAAAALAILETGPVAVLVSDIGMPVTDGYELIRRVRSAASPSLHELPAIAVTAFCTAGDRTKAHSAGFQEHLAKPFDAAQLVEAVQRLLASS